MVQKTVGSVDFSSTLMKLDKVTADAKRELAAALYLGGLKIEENAKGSIAEGGKSGKAYKRGNRTHIASAAGEAPATDYGRLVTSFNVSAKARGLQVDITSGGGAVAYAVDLEFGTSKMAARPFMKPALDKALNYIHARMEKAVQRAIAKNANK